MGYLEPSIENIIHQRNVINKQEEVIKLYRKRTEVTDKLIENLKVTADSLLAALQVRDDIHYDIKQKIDVERDIFLSEYKLEKELEKDMDIHRERYYARIHEEEIKNT